MMIILAVSAWLGMLTQRMHGGLQRNAVHSTHTVMPIAPQPMQTSGL